MVFGIVKVEVGILPHSLFSRKIFPSKQKDMRSLDPEENGDENR